jgi:hypothetical protein
MKETLSCGRLSYVIAKIESPRRHVQGGGFQFCQWKVSNNLCLYGAKTKTKNMRTL